MVASNEVGVVVALNWRATGSSQRQHRYEALKVSDGLIYDMQDYLSERDARRALRRP